jgi:hypothetical protein
LNGRRFDDVRNGHSARKHKILHAFKRRLVQFDEQKARIVQSTLCFKTRCADLAISRCK